MENHKKRSLDSLGEPWAKLSRELAYLEILNDIKNLLNVIPSKIFFTYEEDKEEKKLYHIYFNEVLCHSLRMASEENLQAYIKSLEFASMKGCAYSLEEIVNSIQEKVIKKNE